jgi:5-methylthioadenosine/S-adenosylhomocysteine deaminase
MSDAPSLGDRMVITGRVVTMNDQRTVVPSGAVYLAGGTIAAVQPASAPAPEGFGDSPHLATRGTIYPGLIELHNHLSYNILRLWPVPKEYGDRNQWAGTSEYRTLISGPMGVIGRHPELVPALVRYVEAKCLVAGVTTTQGIALYSDAGIRKYYRGVVRNVEQPADPALSAASDRISDVAAADVSRFWTELQRSHCLLLHLAEGTDSSARQHFLDLALPDGDWAISPQLAGIHAVGLQDQDVKVFADHGGAMVWSPLSNLLLYGDTARVGELHAAGVRIGIGSDWSPSGSKNLLGELKITRLWNESQDGGPVFTDEDLVAMATRNAASILGWEGVGSIEPGKRADLLAVRSEVGDPYGTLIESTESDVVLVTIEGVPRFGWPSLIRPSNPAAEPLRVGGADRLLNLADAAGDPDVASLSLITATSTLRDALQRLPELAAAPVAALAAAEEGAPTWRLALDEIEDTGFALRTTLPGERELLEAAPPIQLPSLELDPLTVIDDHDWLDAIAAEPNLPAYLAPGLRALYS